MLEYTNMEEQESIAHKLNASQQAFFRKFEHYTGEKLYFYGSVTRFDYIPGKSDIDLAIFSPNLESTIHKISTFLQVNRTKFKKIILKIKNTIVHGVKVAFQKEEDDINIEISMFDEKNKSLVEHEWEYKKRKMSAPTTIIFYLVKVCYYILGILNLEQYRYIKLLFMDDDTNFIKVANV